MDRTSHVVPYEVVSLAMRAPHGINLWFDLRIDGMDGYVVSVYPVNLGRQEVVSPGHDRYVKFTFMALDRDDNTYNVDVFEPLPGAEKPTSFTPHMIIERTDAPEPKPRKVTTSEPGIGPAEPRHAVRSRSVTPGARGGV